MHPQNTPALVAHTCAHCGTMFERKRRSREQHAYYCSRTCYYAAGRLWLACEHCGQPFARKASEARPYRFCSKRCQNAAYRAGLSVAEWFWTHVEKTEGCWLWQGLTDAHGYGSFSLPREGKSTRRIGAHRYAWHLLHGSIPRGLVVCHNCPGGDNPRCVNPAHLFLGTQKDNMSDAVGKGRTAAGVRNGQAKVTEDDVRAMRAAHAAGTLTLGALGRRYGLGETATRAIVKRRAWKHIP